MLAALSAFAKDRDLRIERPRVAPVATDEVVVLYAREWESYSVAMKLGELLAAYGLKAHVIEGRLQHHVVTTNHIAVFVGSNDGGSLADEDAGTLRQLICSPNDEAGEAVVLLFANRDMEIQTYVWEGEKVSGENYHGTWGVDGERVVLSPEVRERLEYEPSAGCLTHTLGAPGSCRGTLRWLRGDSVPVLSGCDLEVRNVTIVFEAGGG